LLKLREGLRQFVIMSSMDASVNTRDRRWSIYRPQVTVIMTEGRCPSAAALDR
jgi:hypothetical protein